MQVQVIINSACALKNVNWRHGMLHPYAVLWIDSSGKCSTKVDLYNGVNPVWDEKFTIPFPTTSRLETAILYIDIVHANAPAGTKPLVGSVRLPLNVALAEARANGKAPRSLNLTRPSGRPQGSVEIKIGVKDPNIYQINPYNQQTPYMQQAVVQPRPQIQPQRKFQPQPQWQPQVQPINQYPNKPAPVRPVVYPANLPGLVRPVLPVQGPSYPMHIATNRPVYRPVKPVPVQENYNPTTGTNSGAEVIIVQTQNVQLANNGNNDVAMGTVGGNDNGKCNDDAIGNSKEEYARETPNVLAGCDNGVYEYSEHGTKEGYNNGGYDAYNGVVVCDSGGGYIVSADVECDNGVYGNDDYVDGNEA